MSDEMDKLKLQIDHMFLKKSEATLFNSNSVLDQMVKEQSKHKPAPNYMVGTVVTYNVNAKLYQGLIVGASYENDGPFSEQATWVYEIKRNKRIDAVPERYIIDIIVTNMQDLIKRL